MRDSFGRLRVRNLAFIFLNRLNGILTAIAKVWEDPNLQSEFSAGAQVAWAVPQGQLVMHRSNEMHRGEPENLVSGVVASVARLGDNAILSIHVGGAERPPLFMSVPLHVARHNKIEMTSTVTFSMLREGIHLMPPDKNLTADLVMTL